MLSRRNFQGDLTILQLALPPGIWVNSFKDSGAKHAGFGSQLNALILTVQLFDFSKLLTLPMPQFPHF